MSKLVAWDRLVRYCPVDGDDIRYGQPILTKGQEMEISQLAQAGKLEVEVLDGPSPFDVSPTGRVERVGRLLGPLRPQDVPIVRCIGLNYKTHSG